MADPDALVDEQIAYCRARAPEYDEWWLRQGVHDRGPEFLARWEDEAGMLHRELARFDPRGHVLELAAGTGNLTIELARTAEHLTAVDASSEALAIARSKLDAMTSPAACPVDLVVADVFEWRPSRRYDAVCFAFWLSHVPPGRFDEFWSTVADSLRPGGRVFFADNRRQSDFAADNATSVRTLNDGSTFTIVKRFWEPDELTSVLGELGWTASVAETPSFFFYGSAVRG
jgi:demethylmenaquinone methyltransferase/2-methoxy-6-polyprenyl-1,4-benzoquinol methylase